MVWVGILLFLIGLRVLQLACVRGGGPESGVAVFFLASGLGGPTLFSASIPGEVGPSDVPLLVGTGQAMLVVAFCGLYCFVWQTFGPSSRWRRAAALLGCVAGVATWASIAIFEGFDRRPGPITLTLLAQRFAAVSWAFAETARYARRMKRRVTIGLADPVVANRFVLWEIWTGAFLVVVVLAAGMRFSQLQVQAGAMVDVPLLVVMLRAVVIAGAGIGGIAMFLSFFPPPRYVAWLRAGTQATG